MSRQRTGGVLATLALAISVIALAALGLSGPGSRMGWWHFRIGFTLMQWAAYGAIAAAAVALLALIVGGRRGRAAVALVVAAGVFAVPFAFRRKAMSVPPIHDITTDTADPPQFVDVVARRAAAQASNPPEYAGPEVAAQQKRAYPDLLPITLAYPPARAFDRARAAVESFGWEIVAADPAQGRIEATDTTRFFGFKDDVVIRIRPEGSGSRVDVRSKSRVGRSDVGANAARIRAFRDALAR
jgi:uncharacterized protein (DUF1499 family)